ncbi:hypothetical protein AA0111_g12465 [Alternaria arborescens]|uniref:hypothetical protein n=1 Tax=Alternaria arborescens TaxID=156630 RepID=UPI0010754E68|nr:hypothetical protein AA0111_g12465 [Alternaria arborescens]RYO12746.1 hypothetical protein AA0111_g12465 [Alternaria arborescens]
MDPIQEAIQEIESCEPGEHFSYQQLAKKYGVNRCTLARRHKGLTEAYGVKHLSLHPQHETELVRYIDTLTERRLPPTREMIQRFASDLAGKAVSETWVSRFLQRHPNHLISGYSKGMSKLRCNADSGAKYSLYFKLLVEKVEEYNVQPSHIFNMDEKGFQLGRIGRTKRIFSKARWDKKGIKVFKPPLIKRSFEATSIHPPNPAVVLNKFAKEGSDSEASSTSVLSGEDWLKLKSIVRREVRDLSSKGVKKLQRSLHHLAAQNTLLHRELKGLRESLAIKKRRETKSYTLQLEDHPEYHGGAVWWSPTSVKRARDHKIQQQQQQAELEKLQKAKQAEIKKAARDCEAQLKAAKRVEREKRADEKREEEAEKIAKKQHQQLINNTKKLIELSQKGKRKASQPHTPAAKRQKRGGVALAVVGAARVPQAAPPRSRRQRPITPSKRLSE